MQGDSITEWKGRTLLLGGLLGAVTGLGVAFLLVRRAEKRAEPVKLSTGEGIRLGLILLGLLRQVSELGEGSD